MPRRSSVVMLTADRQIDRRILLEADSLTEAGWDVTIVAMAPDKPFENEDPRVVRLGQAAPSGNKRSALVLDAYRLVRRAFPMNGRLMRALKAAAWRYLVDQEEFFVSLFLETALRYRPDVFLAHDLPMLPVAHRAAEQTGAKLAYDSHELYAEQEFSQREKRRWKEIETRHIGACSAVTTVNPSIARELEKRYGLAHVNVLLNAERTARPPVKTRLFHEIYGLAPTDKVLLFQGGVTAGRNLDVLVGAMRHVTNKAIHLVFLGDGQLAGSLERKAKAAGLAGRVHFHAAVPQRELLRFSEAADGGIIPYQATCLNNFYCTPNKLFEFVAAGLPILASDLPEIRSMIEAHGIGLVSAMKTEEALASSIDAFLGDETQLALWRQSVLQARETLCWEKEGPKIVSIFEALR